MSSSKNICAVIIPVYRDPYLREGERISFERCIEILGDYDIILVHPKKLTVSSEVLQRVKRTCCFDDSYFESISGYNRLLLSSIFYKRFTSYEYILIYQLDAYVFRDELRFWCQQGYDYIGGVWFSDGARDGESGLRLWKPGNGGVSLRKVSAFSRVLRCRRILFTPRQIYWLFVYAYRHKSLMTWLREALLSPLKVFGFQNNLRWLAKHTDMNEDVFYATVVSEKTRFMMPSIEDAVLFSWDRNPADLYRVYNRLPCCCHAWWRNDGVYEGNYDFWRKMVSTQRR